MDEPELFVKHFVACSRITAAVARVDAPYTLSGVQFGFDVPADREWPVRLDRLWLYVRFYFGSGERWFGLSVVWVDAPEGGEREVAYFEMPVVFPDCAPVFGRGWNVSAVRYEGPGRYCFYCWTRTATRWPMRPSTSGGPYEVA